MRRVGTTSVNNMYILNHDMNDNWRLKYMGNQIDGTTADNVSKGLYELDTNGGTYVLKKEFHMLNEHSFPTILPSNYSTRK